MVTDEALIAETVVWSNFFLINIFFALKGSKLFIIMVLGLGLYMNRGRGLQGWFKQYLFLILIIQLHTNKVTSIIVFLSRIRKQAIMLF